MSKLIENISNKDLNRLKNIFTPTKIQQGATVSFSGAFMVLHQDFSIGNIYYGKLQITPKDIRQIRKLIKDLSGFDLLTDPIPKTRIEMAKYFPNEKLSTTPVKDKVVKIYGVLSTNINGKTYTLEDSMNIELPLRSLKSIEHKQVVIVENYEAFSKFRDIQSDMGPNPLVVYRGDLDGGVISKEIAENFPHVELISWFDTDPSGISLALACEVTQILLPELSAEVLSRYGRSTLFDDQYRNWEKVSNAIPIELKTLMSQTGKGITQESILANKIPLILHRVK